MTQSTSKREFQTCDYRQEAEGQRSAVCRLLGEISGVSDDSLLCVEPDACQACCDSFYPTKHDWNPVIASLLHQLASEVQSRGGTAGCSPEQARQLAQAAIRNLPTVLAHEDDVVDDLQNFGGSLELSLQELKQFLPLPSTSRSEPKITWAFGVTTAPRRQPTLSVCLRTIIESGWHDPHLFIDGDVTIEREFSSLPRTRRAQPSGAWPAWCAALQDLFDNYPDANTLAIVQDDALFPAIPKFRRYVEDLLWPGQLPGIVSLYTSADDMQSENVWRRHPDKWRYGAVAILLPRELAAQMLRNIAAGDLEFLSGSAGIDTRIGVWAERMNVPIWHPSPSLVQHIGQVSSIWKRSRAVGLRRASRFLNDEL